jgi:hypothetical protein
MREVLHKDGYKPVAEVISAAAPNNSFNRSGNSAAFMRET